ncbi:hypothetical protein [Bacteroides sp. 519]|uniref:hypothetical protein n=1 Tax=Bacteroides sp. 519 TaxID=2302937 RepID=UPI0013D70D5C|nr:hypothetical protein [Bacteroides sp. 519]NDV58092.1 hypothetical protein [Bacteroides sp. 519]
MTFDETHVNSSHIISNDDRPIIVLKDKKEPRQYIGKNDKKKQVTVYRIDDGILKNGEKCDYAISINITKTVYFIELKGGDYTKALSQIHSTIKTLILDSKTDTTSVNARVVLSKVRVPNIKSTQEIKLVKLLKALNGDLKKETQKMIEIL